MGAGQSKSTPVLKIRATKSRCTYTDGVWKCNTVNLSSNNTDTTTTKVTKTKKPKKKSKTKKPRKA